MLEAILWERGPALTLAGAFSGIVLGTLDVDALWRTRRVGSSMS